MKKTHLILLLISLAFLKGNAQGIAFFGNTYIDSGGIIYVKDYPVVFEGTVYTSGSIYPGMLVLSENTAWQRENNEAFVDGSVKSYHTGEFEFPIGNEAEFAPIRVSSNGAVTSSYLFDSASDTNVLADDLDAVSNIEHWKIISNSEGILTLTWRNESDLATLTNNDLDNLRIAAWNSVAMQWEAIPYQTLTGDINSGSLVSQEDVDFNDYSTFTFGMKDTVLSIGGLPTTNVLLYIKDGFLNMHSTNSDILTLSFFDMAGRLLVNYKSINGTQYKDTFSYPKGIYIARITMRNGQIVHQKVVNQ